MPYSGAGDPGLPDYVKKMPEAKRKQWVEVFMSAWSKYHDEGKAFRMANGVVKKSAIETLVFDFVERIKSLFADDITSSIQFKEVGGQIRFFTVFSNCFKDSHKEIISSVAHEEYSQWVNRTKQFPQLWLWHAGPKSKWGQVDFIDYVDGFMVASGLVDADKAYIAKALEKEATEVSHGFAGLIDPSGVYHLYRTFEISPLPSGRAANSFTGFKVGAMPFSQERKDWLKAKANLTDADITEWEASLESLSSNLKASGVEWKASDSDNIFVDIIAVTKSVSDVAAKLQDIATKQAAFDTTLTEFATKMQEFTTKVDDATKSLDAKVEEKFLAQVASAPQGFRASESNTNKVEGEKAKKDSQWFDDIISGILR
jgi:hypothetical protein